MSLNAIPQNKSQKPKYQLLKTLTLFQVIMMGLAYMQPTTMFDTFAIVSHKTGGHVPTSYIIALIAILFTALSYGKLVQRYPSSGSAYTYTQKAIGPRVGFIVGWSSLMDYMLMPMINALLVQIYLTAMFPAIPGWIPVVAMVLIMTIANLKSINIVANLNTVIVLLQILTIFVFIGLVIYGMMNKEGATSLFTLRPFFSADAKIHPLLTGATILCFSFLGFDGISSLSEETKDARRVIPKAMFMTTLIGGLLFISASYFIQLYFPDVSQFKKLDESLPQIALLLGGALFQSIILYFGCATMVASGLAAHAGVSRQLYVMGRDGVFPERFFGYIHPHWRTPAFNIVLVGAFALTAVFFTLDLAISLISFGALIAFTFVNLSVISLFYIREQRNSTLRDTIHYLLLPLCGALCVGVMWLSLDIHSFQLGLIWGTLGICYLGLITKMFRVPPPHVELEPAQ